MPTEIITQLENALGETVSLLSSFNEKELNTVPFEGSWTAAQVGRHLFKSEDGIDALFHAKTQSVTRPPDEKAGEFKKLFLDFTIKMNAPDFLIPERTDYDKGKLIELLSDTRAKVLKALETSNLSQIAPLEDNHPLKGSTKLEIVHFMAYHAMRHNHQIKKIKKVVQA